MHARKGALVMNSQIGSIHQAGQSMTDIATSQPPPSHLSITGIERRNWRVYPRQRIVSDKEKANDDECGCESARRVRIVRDPRG